MRLPRLAGVRWPTVLLLASVALTTVGVLDAARAVRSHRAVVRQALRDYAGFVSWSYQQHLRESLGALLHETLGAVNHGDDMHTAPQIPDARALPHYLPWDARCSCHRPDFGPSPALYFGFVLGADTLGVAVNTHPDPREGWEVDRALPHEPTAHAPTVLAADRRAGRALGYSDDERRWLLDTLTRQIRGAARRPADRLGNFPLIVAMQRGAAHTTPRVLAYTLMPTAWGDTVVYGAEYAPTAFARLLSGVLLDRGLLPASIVRDHSARDMIRLQVSDAEGESIVGNEPGAWSLDDTTRLPATFGALRVRTQIRAPFADELIIGGVPTSHVPLLLALLAVSAALGFVALGQLRREGELARLRGTFVDSVSHELRTPIAQMRVYLETLRLGRFETEEQRRRAVEHVERETTRLGQLVERVLHFSAADRPDARVVFGGDATRDVDVADEVTRLVEEFRPLAAARRVEIVTELAPVPLLRLHEGALRHVLVNLLDNAVKYGPTGQTVRVRVAASDDEVRIEVADEGPGVSAADRETIWEPYRRGGGARHVSGSGIGLAIVRDVVSQYDGRAWVAESGAGGALFVVALPVERAASAVVAAR